MNDMNDAFFFFRFFSGIGSIDPFCSKSLWVFDSSLKNRGVGTLCSIIADHSIYRRR